MKKYLEKRTTYTRRVIAWAMIALGIVVIPMAFYVKDQLPIVAFISAVALILGGVSDLMATRGVDEDEDELRGIRIWRTKTQLKEMYAEAWHVPEDKVEITISMKKIGYDEPD